MKLRKEISDLLMAGIINQDTADRIEQYYITKAGPPQNKLVIVFGILGALLVGLGTILILAHNWDLLSRPVKTGIAFVPLVLGQILCAYSLFRNSKSLVWKESSSAFLVIAIGACIAMIGQIYNVPGDLYGYLLTWILLALPVVYIMSSSVASLLYIIGITMYACGIGYWDSPVSESYIYWALLAAVIPYYYLLYRHNPGSNFFTFHNWFIPISVITVLGVIAQDILELMFVAYISLFGLLYLVGNTPVLRDQKIRNNGYLVLGSLGTVTLLLALSFDWFWQDLRSGEFLADKIFTSPEFFVSAILSLAALALLIIQKRRQELFDIRPIETVFILFIGVFIVGTRSPLVTVLINLILLGIGILTIREGARRNHFGILNYGLLIVMALIICRFFDIELSFVLRGILFVAVGCGFFFANYWMAKRKKLAVRSEQ